MDKVDQLIRLIDNELLNIYNAFINKQTYSHFNFKSALHLLNEEWIKTGYTDLSIMKGSRYINIFNDLCNTIMESIDYRYISYDPSTYIVVKRIRFNDRYGIDNHEHDMEINIETDSKDLYLKLEYPTNYVREYEKTKFQYFTSGKYGIVLPEGHIAPNYNPELLNKNDRFDSFFKIHSDEIDKHKITFEVYIQKLLDDKSIEEKIRSEQEKEEADKKRKEMDIIIELIVNELIPDFISIRQKQLLLDLFKTNYTSGEINWLGKIDHLTSSVISWHKRGLIEYPSGIDTKKFILKYFIKDGKQINPGTLGNSISNEAKR